MLICRRKGALKKNTYFRIGDLSKLFHVGVDSIRYYEKVGLLHPVRNPENGYRQYTLDDIRTMNTIRELLDLGFSTEEILKFEKDRNLSHMQVMLEKEADVIDQKIAELEKTKNEIRGRLHAIRRNLELDCSGEVSELELPERQCLMIRNADMPDNMINYEVAKFTQTMKEKVATIGACDCYTRYLPQRLLPRRFREIKDACAEDAALRREAPHGRHGRSDGILPHRPVRDECEG